MWTRILLAVALALGLAGSAAATVVYDLRVDGTDFSGHAWFSEPDFLTSLTTISAFDVNTLTSSGSPAQYAVISPVVGGDDCVLVSGAPPGGSVILSAHPGCFGLHFLSGSQALTGMQGNLTSIGHYGVPGIGVQLTIRRGPTGQVPEPSSILLLLIAVGAAALSRRRCG
jgi:PEP-CTERM motif